MLLGGGGSGSMGCLEEIFGGLLEVGVLPLPRELRGGGSGSIGGRLLNPHPNPYSPRHIFTHVDIWERVSIGISSSTRCMILFLHDLKQ